MKFKCLNGNCSEFNIVKEFIKTTHKFINGEFVCSQGFCIKCGEKMQDITEVIPLSEKGVNFSKFNSLSKEDKTKKLKQRSHDHFEKNIKDHRHDLLNKAMNEFKNM